MPFTLRVVALGLCSLFLVLAPSQAGAWSIDDLAKVNSHLKRAESNLTLVDGSIGHLKSPPKGSAGKLAKMRLAQAQADLEPAGKLLAGVQSGAGLDETKARYEKDLALYNKLAGILDGKPPASEEKPPEKKSGDMPPAGTPPEKKSGGTPPAGTPPEKMTGETPPGGTPPEKTANPKPTTPATVKLGYPHADNFKNTLFTLRRVEGDVVSVLQVLEQLRPVEDPLSIDHRTTAATLAKITETFRQAGFVKDGLAKIPANGEGVAEAQQRLVNANASLSVAKEFIAPINTRLVALVDPSNYPDFAGDVKRLRELSSMYGNPGYLFREDRAQAAEALGQVEAANAECQRIAQAYRRLMQQKTEQGKQLEAVGNGFLGQVREFLAAAEAQKQSLPADIRKDLGEADQYATEAVQNQKPLWFTGGIPQRMEWAEDKLALYRALNPAGAEQVANEVEAMKSSLKERADSLKALIIRENPLPPDNFAGGDRDAAIAVALDAWKIQQPDFELLSVRIPSESWRRETKWTYSNGTWYFIDKSTLQVRLIVADKDNPEQAVDRPINVRKDHQNGDSLIGVPMRSIDESLEPSEYLLRSRIK